MKQLCLLIALLSLFSCTATEAQKTNVQDDIQKKLKEQIEGFEKPSPAVVNAVLDQIRSSCRVNRTINEEEIATEMNGCMEKLFNQTELANELEEAIPKGNLDNVFRKICLKWPKVKGCLKPGLNVVEECWENGTLVSSAMDTMVDFFCGKNNDGAYIALFFAEGGMGCLEQHGNTVRDCVNEQNTDEHQEDLCVSVNQLFHCLTPLRKCDDVTPHNLVSSMIMEVGNVMKCPPIMAKQETSSSLRSVPVAAFAIVAIFLNLLVN